MTGDDIVARARDLLHTPFRHQGRLPGRALDCAGLVVIVADRMGLAYADQSGYSRMPTNGQLEDALDRQPGLVRVDDMQPGDILLMRFNGDPQHLAIFTGEGVIHAYQPIGEVCEHRMTQAWRSRVVRIYRFSGVADG